MILSRVNLREKLESFRNRSISEEEILRQVYTVLRSKDQAQEDINTRLRANSEVNSNDLDLGKLETSRIFHLSHIKKIAVNYRLRFLNTKYFKSPLPPEAYHEIQQLEQEHQTTIRGFRILAPSKHFRLENADDPILFAPIGNNYFYLIHKWGNDINPLRKTLMWPLKSIENLGVFVIVFSFLAAFVFRELFFSQYRSTSEFIMLFLFTFKSIGGLILFYGIALGKNFNNSIWRSKYDKA